MSELILKSDLRLLNDRILNLGSGLATMPENGTMQVGKAFLTATLGYMEELLGWYRAQPANEPLTLDELREMEGEPVYDGHALQWYVIEDVDIVDELSTIICMTDGEVFDSEDGLPPFYRRKPEESENDYYRRITS